MVQTEMGIQIPEGIWRGKQRGLEEWIDFSNEKTKVNDIRGTFADNMKEPIHRWFRYSAGFSYDIVEECLDLYNVTRKDTILDPFVGSGTTCVCAKKRGIPSIGIETHQLVAWIAKVKTHWDLDFSILEEKTEAMLFRLKSLIKNPLQVEIDKKPKLLEKCFSLNKLNELYTIKKHILHNSDEEVRNLATVALISTLREVSKAHTGWPYILPKKTKKNVPDVYETYSSQLRMMVSDLKEVVTEDNKETPAEIIMGDSRKIGDLIEHEAIDFAFTSPPYLNNYDYADRTRLELYFLSPFKVGNENLDISTWGDIREQIRKKLLVSVSHQAKELGLKEGLLPDTEIGDPVRNELITIAKKLRTEKRTHGGHKAYDIMVIAYFNDILKTLKEVFRVLRPDAYYLLILGDSAPYGVHVPTDVYIAQIALEVGFSDAKIAILRKRGGKWKSAPKHSVPLRESMVVLRK